MVECCNLHTSFIKDQDNRRYHSHSRPVQFSKATAGYINVNHLTTLSVVWATKIVGKRRKQAMGYGQWGKAEKE
jgi:hypothetical protein